MRILQLLPELKVGGVERGTIDLSEHLVSQGHESAVVSAGGDLVKLLNHFLTPTARTGDPSRPLNGNGKP